MDTTWKLTVEFDSKDDAEHLLQIIDDWETEGRNELSLLVSGLEEVTSETSLVRRIMTASDSARAEAEAEKYGVAMEIGIDIMEGSND